MRSKLENPWFGAVLLALLLAIVATSCQSAPRSLVNGEIVSDSSPFPAVLVKPGGIVTWNNGTGMTHTVTSD